MGNLFVPVRSQPLRLDITVLPAMQLDGYGHFINQPLGLLLGIPRESKNELQWEVQEASMDH